MELEYMNILNQYIVKQLNDLRLGLEGALTISENMEKLISSITLERVPEMWSK